MLLTILFRIFYTSLYGLLYIVLLGLLLITPADIIRQALLVNHQPYNVYIIAAIYFFTGVSALIIYAARIWTNRAVMKGIPKTYIPVEKEEVSRKVRKMIAGGFARSAVIAWDSYPRVDVQSPTIISHPEAINVVVKVPEVGESKSKSKGFSRKRKQTEKEDQTVIIAPDYDAWKAVAHDGWSSPASPDLPNLHFITVIMELPHLIEAKAVSLAPPDPNSPSHSSMPDLRVVDLLQRPISMGLREYLGHLIGFGVLTSSSIAADFLTSYEYARFSTNPLSEHEFRDLMKQFADVLRHMQSPAPLIDAEGSDPDDDGSSLMPETPRTRSITSFKSSLSSSGSEGTVRTTSSRNPGITFTKHSDHLPTFKSNKRPHEVARSPSLNNLTQTRIPYTPSNNSSSSSLRSPSQSSIIKLSRTDGSSSDLPYTITLPG